MDKSGRESLLQHTRRGGGHLVGEGGAAKKCRGGFSTESMDNKENICVTALENGSESSSIHNAMPAAVSAKRGGSCNLRKSLAWNKAFFTEEGVLDPLELSILGSSVTKSSMRLLDATSGENTPLMNYGVSSRQRLDCKAHQESVYDANVDLFSAFESSSHKKTALQSVAEMATGGKGISRINSRTPAGSSQKRLANTSSSHQASKLPRFTVTRPESSSHFLNPRSGQLTNCCSSQNGRPDIYERNIGPKSSLLISNAALSFSTSSSRSSEHEGKTLNKKFELPPSADIRTSNMGKSVCHLKTPETRLPTYRLSSSTSSSNIGRAEHSSSLNAPYFQAGCTPQQAQGKPSGLRMPTPSLGFFCQPKIPPQSIESQESQKYNAPGLRGHSLRDSRYLKHIDDFKTMHASQRQSRPTGSESVGTKSCATLTSFNSKNVCSGNVLMPSVTTSTVNKGIVKVASRRKMLSATKSQVERTREKNMHAYRLVDEMNKEKQTSSQSSECEPESPTKHLVSTEVNSSLPIARKFSTTLKREIDLGNACGIYPSMECSGYVMSQSCSPKQLQQDDCLAGESSLCQQLEEARETSTSASNEFLPGGEQHSSVGSTSMPQLHSSKTLHSVVEDKSRESHVRGLEKCRSNHNVTFLEEGHNVKRTERLDCEVSVLNMENQLSSPDKSKALIDKEEAMEKPEKVAISLNHLKVVPFTDEWFAALETFGEDVLLMKTGAVQNSPRDKPSEAVGPWSPVKRKNLEIGPYDCTKHNKSASTFSDQ